MNSARKAALIAGILFIAADATGILSTVLCNPVLHAPDYLARVSSSENTVILGGLLEFLMGAACAGIALSMYAVLRKYNKGLAIGSVGFGIIEGLLFMLAAISLFLFVPLSQEITKAGPADPPYFQTLGHLLKAGYVSADNLAGIAFALGALMYYYIFYRSGLIPRWLSIWGLASVTLCLLESLLAMFHLAGPTVQSVLIAPLGLEEIVLALWLILKGFNLPEMNPGTPGE